MNLKKTKRKIKKYPPHGKSFASCRKHDRPAMRGLKSADQRGLDQQGFGFGGIMYLMYPSTITVELNETSFDWITNQKWQFVGRIFVRLCMCVLPTLRYSRKLRRCTASRSPVSCHDPRESHPSSACVDQMPAVFVQPLSVRTCAPIEPKNSNYPPKNAEDAGGTVKPDDDDCGLFFLVNHVLLRHYLFIQKTVLLYRKRQEKGKKSKRISETMT